MIRLKGIKNIVFDFGGVLVDLKQEACLQAFADLGVPQVADYLTPYGHKGPFGKMEDGEIDVATFCDEFRETFNVPHLTNLQIEEAWGAFLVHIPFGKMKMVHELAKRYRVFLLSNTNEVHIRKLQEFEDAGFPVNECFEKCYLSYQIGSSKPGRAIFQHVLDDAGILAEETLLVDDGPANCRTAAEMGFKTYQPAPYEDFTAELLQPGACVATMGFFDGVHRGHRYLIDETLRIASEKQLPSMVISFWPHPRTVLQTNFCPQLLTNQSEKESLLLQTGTDYVRTVNFDLEISGYSAQRFMEEILRDEFHIKTLIIGFDHRFGNQRSDDFEAYKQYGEALGMEVIQASPVLVSETGLASEEPGQTISSSLIRRWILAGKVKESNVLLGRCYSLRGKVVGGHQIGRQIGFPTANIEPLEEFKLIPSIGVYAVWVLVGEKRYKGMMDIGRRPTLHSDSPVSIEVHLLDFDGDLYHRELTIEFVERFRSDVAFPDVEALVEQLHKDKAYVSSVLQFPEFC